MAESQFPAQTQALGLGAFRFQRSHPLTWLVLLAAVYLLRLGAAPLFDVDEGAFSEATREMLASGDFGHTTLNGADRFDKPILVYWLQAFAASWGGINEWTMRLPSVLCTLLLAIQAGLFAQKRWGENTGWLAAMMLGTSLGFMALGRAATADGLLNALLALTALNLWRFAENGERSALRLAYSLAALGFLAKGPVAIIVPAAALALWSILSDRGRTLRQALLDARGWCYFSLIALPWYLYALNRHGMAFVDGFFLKHNVERFSGAMEGHGGSLAYYLVVWPLLCLPWSALALLVLVQLRSLWQDATCRFLLIWAAFVFVFFSLSGTKLPHYLLYGTAPLLLLMARVAQKVNAGPALHRCVNTLLALGAFVQALLLALPPLLANRLSKTIADPTLAELLGTAERGHTVAVGVTALLALSMWWGWRWAGANPSFIWRFSGVSLALSASLSAFVLPWWGGALQSPVAELARWAKTQGVNVVQWQVHQPSVGFYQQAPSPRRAPEAGEWALVRRNRLPEGIDPSHIVKTSRGWALVRPSLDATAVHSPTATPSKP